jgi:DNA-binding NarL/FixJ family response regulator
MKVLIVDDDEMQTRAFERALRDRFSIRTANTIAQAVVALHAELPDVLVCDFELAGETSTELLRRVKREFPSVRRVLFSGSQPERWAELVAEATIDAAITKPATIATIVESLSGL